MKDYYYILGVNKSATQEDIKKAYRKLSIKFHPDKNDGDEFFSERFKEILEAYNVLGNESKRLEYDYKILFQSNSNNEEKRQKSYDPTIEYFDSDVNSFYSGDTLTLKWKTEYADKIVVVPFNEQLSPNGKKSYRLNNINKEILEITLQATNSHTGKYISKTITIHNKLFHDIKNDKNTFNSDTEIIYSHSSIIWAIIFGGVVGGLLLGHNLKIVGKTKISDLIKVCSIFVGIIHVVLVSIDVNITGFNLLIFSMLLYLTNKYNKEIHVKHKEADGRFYSGWKTFGYLLAYMAVLLFFAVLGGA